MQPRWLFISALWLVALAMILSPGLLHMHWQARGGDRAHYARYAEFVIPAYLVGNLLSLIYVAFVAWQFKRLRWDRVGLVISTWITLLIVALGFIGMGSYISEFIAG